jgi:ABC-type sugar transport system ATPase subunit
MKSFNWLIEWEFLQPNNLETAELFGKINVFNEQLLDAFHIDSKKGLIGLRPYHLKIRTKSQKNSLKASVLSCKFMGGYYQVVCELEKNLKWTVHSEHAHKAGEQIFLSFEKSHLIEMNG